MGILGTIRPIRKSPTPKRNVPCPCGSGRKFKRCCARRPSAAEMVKSMEPEKDEPKTEGGE